MVSVAVAADQEVRAELLVLLALHRLLLR